MTYNIRLGIQQGVEAVARVIAAQSPDIVAIQEVGRNWRMGSAGDTAAEIAEYGGFEHHAYVTCLHEEGDHRYGHALLSRWPIESREIDLFSKEIDEQRAALVCEIPTPAGRVQVVSTHLSHRPPERSMHGTELVQLIGRLLDEQTPTLLMGDLNEDEDVDWLNVLTDRMNDAGELAPEPTYPARQPQARIDYLLIHGGRWLDARVLEEQEASDHRPVIGQLEI